MSNTIELTGKAILRTQLPDSYYGEEAPLPLNEPLEFTLYKNKHGLILVKIHQPKGSYHIYREEFINHFEILVDGLPIPVPAHVWQTLSRQTRYRLWIICKLSDTPSAYSKSALVFDTRYYEVLDFL